MRRGGRGGHLSCHHHLYLKQQTSFWDQLFHTHARSAGSHVFPPALLCRPGEIQGHTVLQQVCVWGSSSPTPATLGLALRLWVARDWVGRAYLPHPMPPHRRQVAGPALPCSHPWGWLICNSCNQGQLYCASWVIVGAAVQSTAAVEGWGQLSSGPALPE